MSFIAQHTHSLQTTPASRKPLVGCDICQAKGVSDFFCNTCNYDVCEKCFDPFRFIAVLTCDDCGYMEFAGCGRHNALLGRPVTTATATAAAAAAAVGAAVGGAGSSVLYCYDPQCHLSTLQFSHCKKCSGSRISTHRWCLRVKEAGFVKQQMTAGGAQDNVTAAVLVCSSCMAIEFPATEEGGLVDVADGKIVCRKSKNYLPSASWNITHHPTCADPKNNSNMSFVKIILSKKEAEVVGTYIQTTNDAAAVANNGT